MKDNFKNLESIITKKGTIQFEISFPSHYNYETNPYEIPFSLREPDLLPYDSYYKIKNVQNVNLYKTSLVPYFIENDTITFTQTSFSISRDFFCDFLFQTKYIDKFAYTIDNENYVYFGGTPEDLINHHYNYTFGDKIFQGTYFESLVSKINIEINNENRFKINLYDKLLFSYNKYCKGIICLQSSDFKKFQKEFNNFTLNNNYNFTKNNYPFSISFKISDKIFNISLNGNPYDYIVEDAIFSLGAEFLNLFDYREYNLESKSKVNFYLNKNKTNVHIYKEINDKNIISYSNCNFDLIYFCMFLFLTIFTVLKAYFRNKNLNVNYFDYYQM